MNQTLSSLTVAQLRQAIVIRENIEALEKQLASVLVGAPAATPATAGKKRTMSPQARAKIGAAQSARWAKKKAVKPAGPAAKAEPKAASKPKRKMTPAGRRRLSELAKARWAKVRASGKTSLRDA